MWLKMGSMQIAFYKECDVFSAGAVNNMLYTEYMGAERDCTEECSLDMPYREEVCSARADNKWIL